MPHHDGTTKRKTRKERKRRVRNSQSARDLRGPKPTRCRYCRIHLASEARLIDHIQAVHPGTLKEPDSH